MTVLPLRPLDTTVRRLSDAVQAAVHRPATSAGRVMALARLTASRPHPMLEDPPARWLGEGPVVLVGGFCATGLVLGPMRRWLERLGYSVTTHTVGAGMDCAGRSVAALDETLHAVAEAHGVPVRIVAHSRGGQFARAAARRTDVPVAGLVTLGTPLDLYGVSRVMILQAAAVAAIGSIGAPGLARFACLYGPCCAEFREGLREPSPVPVTAVFSRGDEAVRWASATDPHARNVEVPGTHLGLLVDPPAMVTVAEALSA